MKQLSLWLVCAAMFASSMAMAADPTGDTPGVTNLSPPAPPAQSGMPAQAGKTASASEAACCTPCPATCCPAASSCEPKVPCLTNSGGDSGCGCDHRGGIVGGVGMYWLQPYFSNNPSYGVVSVPAGFNTTAATSTTSHVDVSHNMDVAPEIWLGYIGDNGFGFRARWWYFRQDTSQSLTSGASPLTGSDNLTSAALSAAPLGVGVEADNASGPFSFSVTTKLQLQVWDFEALQDIQVAGFDLLFSGGLRFAHINQEYNAWDNEAGATNPVSAVTSANSFDGLGPVVALEARRALGNTGLAVYGRTRGALLFGSEHQSAFGINLSEASGGNVNASDSHDRVMPVAELELGVEYGQRIGNMRLFGQIALVGQDWIGAGNASRSNTLNAAGIPEGGSTADSDLAFLGLAFRLGVNY
jgi:hypothetical protein